MNHETDRHEPDTSRTDEESRHARQAKVDGVPGGRGGPGDTSDAEQAGAVRFTFRTSSLGRVLVAASDRGLCAVSLGDEDAALERELRERFAVATILAGDAEREADVDANLDPELAGFANEVVALIASPEREPALLLDLRGTAFQHSVWQELRRIPPGETASYADVAARIGRPRAVRAVAGACAANALAVVIPCHRVRRSSGGLSGYRWGVERKRMLLEHEASLRPH